MRRCKGKTEFKMESGLAELEKSVDARLFYVSKFGGHTGRIRGGLQDEISGADNAAI